MDHELRCAILAGWANGLLVSQIAHDMRLPQASVGVAIHNEREWHGSMKQTFHPDLRRETARRGLTKNERVTW